MIRLYAVGVDSGHGWTELRFRANSDINIHGLVSGDWYTIATPKDKTWTIEVKKTYIIEAEEAWIDTRAGREKYHIVHVKGAATCTEYVKTVEPKETND